MFPYKRAREMVNIGTGVGTGRLGDEWTGFVEGLFLLAVSAKISMAAHLFGGGESDSTEVESHTHCMYRAES